jgi:hypothetical protein
MSKLVKTAAVLVALLSLGACTVVPPQIAYTPPAVVIGARPAPYYGPYYGAPAYMPPPPRYGYRHW